MHYTKITNTVRYENSLVSAGHPFPSFKITEEEVPDTEFVDVRGKKQYDWIPAIRLY
jgi:hypothetical protein